MAAQTVLPQASQSYNSTARRSGVITLYGYGIRVHVDRGHLILCDGIASDRRGFRLSRVGNGLTRLVIIGSDGFVSLSAIRWLASQDVTLTILERDGSVLATTGPVRPSDARLRRAQALAHQSGVALDITRQLIAQKLAGQEQVARKRLLDTKTADAIAEIKARVASAGTIDAILQFESQGASVYWDAWRDLPVSFPRQDRSRTPAHWLSFGTRKSVLSGSQRLATNPPNAMLNYAYAVLESETCLAIAALGLDSGLGLWHTDTPRRDSLACDVMEVVRPQVDAFLLDWITREPLKRSWFFERQDGNCRLMAELAVKLAETAPMWARAVAPVAEWVARELWKTTSKPARQGSPATCLTQQHRSQAQGGFGTTPLVPQMKPERLCRGCGAQLKYGRKHCTGCSTEVSRAALIEAAKLGRVATHSPEAEALRSASQRRQIAARKDWQASGAAAQMSKAFYDQTIRPRLRGLRNSAIASALQVSMPYAAAIRSGLRRPHVRHWLTLHRLVCQKA